MIYSYIYTIKNKNNFIFCLLDNLKEFESEISFFEKMCSTTTLTSLMESIDMDNMTLSDLFDRGWKIQQELNKACDESSESYLLARKRAIEILTKCEFMLDELHIFSTNESVDEVSTSEYR